MSIAKISLFGIHINKLLLAVLGFAFGTAAPFALVLGSVLHPFFLSSRPRNY